MRSADDPSGFDPSAYEAEARDRWGHTDAWQESQRRTASYSEEDWARIRAEAGEIFERIAGAMDRGPADDEVLRGVAAYRRHIDERYYSCTPEMLRGLADMYAQDTRFAAFWERIKPGLAQFMGEAIHAYCDGQRGE